MKRLDVITSKGYLTELVANAKFNKLSNEEQALKIQQTINEAIVLVKSNSVLGGVVGQSEQLVCSCGSRLVKTTGGYHCGNVKCSV